MEQDRDLPTDAEIVERVQRGDVQAYGALVERYERGLLATVWPVVRDVHAARDVVQDVFLQCFLKLSTLRDGSRFGGWVLKAAEREAVRAARRARRVPRRLSQVQPAAREPVAIHDDERQPLLDCVRCLPAHERSVVTLRYFEGHAVHEIARITGRPVGTVTKQLSRALSRLRDELIKESKPCQTSRSMIA